MGALHLVASQSEPRWAAGDLQRLMSGERIGRALTLRIDHRGRLSEVHVVPAELED